MTVPLNILLVEDNPADARLLEEALVDCSVRTTVQSARDGEEAINMLSCGKQEQPDLIILDLNMPKKDGHQFLYEMKEFLNDKDIPVILLTVSDRKEDIDRAFSSRLNFYMNKPVEPRTLDTLLNAISELWKN